jgi:hypothetical protein
MLVDVYAYSGARQHAVGTQTKRQLWAAHDELGRLDAGDVDPRVREGCERGESNPHALSGTGS